MKENLKIYICGENFKHFHGEEEFEWKFDFMRRIMSRKDGANIEPVYNNDTFYYDESNGYDISDSENFKFSMNKLRNSDLVVVNFEDSDDARVAIEMATAYENRIPIVALNVGGCEEAHPWLKECVLRVCSSMDELVYYIIRCFLI